jgi:hypothetical protein
MRNDKLTVSWVIFIFAFAMIIDSAFAGWRAESKFNDAGASSYSKKKVCEAKESEPCFQWQKGYILGTVSIQNVQEDDPTKPILKTPYNLKNCTDPTDCGTKSKAEPADYCLAGDYIQIKENSIMPGYSYYCEGVTGYEQQTIKKVVEDSAAKATKETEIAADKAKRELIRNKMKDINFGKQVIALISVQNDAKNLNSTQIKQMLSTYATIEALLGVGSIDTAKGEVEAITPDGTLVTQANKDEILAMINEYLGQ